MTDTRSYGERFLANIARQMVSRGIPADQTPKVLAHIAKAYGKKAITELHGGQLKQAQQNIEQLMRSFLGGRKRVAGMGDAAWPEGMKEAHAVKTATASMNLKHAGAAAEEG